MQKLHLLLMFALPAAVDAASPTVHRDQLQKHTPPPFGFCGVPGQACGVKVDPDTDSSVYSTLMKRDELLSSSASMTTATAAQVILTTDSTASETVTSTNADYAQYMMDEMGFSKVANVGNTAFTVGACAVVAGFVVIVALL